MEKKEYLFFAICKQVDGKPYSNMDEPGPNGEVDLKLSIGKRLHDSLKPNGKYGMELYFHSSGEGGSCCDYWEISVEEDKEHTLEVICT